MDYTEEDYAQMYSELPEGLKELVLSGRLAILVSAIGSRHGLNADQVADLEPSIEDVCLGLITVDELVENIIKNVNVDQRVANRIAAEAELEILKPFEAELVISRKQKEDLDKKIQTKSGAVKINNATVPKTEPKDVSDHSGAQEKKVTNWYNKGGEENKNKGDFDWDKTLAKKPVEKEEEKVSTAPSVAPNLENKLDQLTESINKLISTRFGSEEKKTDGMSQEMQELVKRLEKAEKENEENKMLIRSLQSQKNSSSVIPAQNIFGSKVQIDKERKVDINHTEPKKEEAADTSVVKIAAISNPIPIQKKESQVISSTVSKDTLDSILEIHNKTSPAGSSIIPQTQTSTKKTLSLDELISGGDMKIKQGLQDSSQSGAPKTGTLVFPGINDEKKIDIKNINQKDAMKETLLADLEFLLKPKNKNTEEGVVSEKTDEPKPDAQKTQEVKEDTKKEETPASTTQTASQSVTTSQFKDELLPKTKEERMRALQDKIKSLNKGVSTGGKTNITASGLDPYRM